MSRLGQVGFQRESYPDLRCGFSEPDTVEIKRVVPIGECKSMAKVVPDMRYNNIEWSMHHTRPNFDLNVIIHWDVENSPNTGTIVFHY